MGQQKGVQFNTFYYRTDLSPTEIDRTFILKDKSITIRFLLLSPLVYFDSLSKDNIVETLQWTVDIEEVWVLRLLCR